MDLLKISDVKGDSGAYAHFGNSENKFKKKCISMCV